MNFFGNSFIDHKKQISLNILAVEQAGNVKTICTYMQKRTVRFARRGEGANLPLGRKFFPINTNITRNF